MRSSSSVNRGSGGVGGEGSVQQQQCGRWVRVGGGGGQCALCSSSSSSSVGSGVGVGVCVVWCGGRGGRGGSLPCAAAAVRVCALVG